MQKGADVYTFSHLRSVCSWGDNQPPVAPQRGTNQALTPWLFSPNVAAAAEPLSCFARLDVSATNWLPTGIQGAKEPLDGQRLEVYPGINVSKSLACVIHRNQPSSLRLAIKERVRFPLLQHHFTPACTLLLLLLRVKRNWTFSWVWMLEALIRRGGFGRLRCFYLVWASSIKLQITIHSNWTL